MEQEKSLVTTGAHNESETTALLVHIDALSHTTQPPPPPPPPPLPHQQWRPG